VPVSVVRDTALVPSGFTIQMVETGFAGVHVGVEVLHDLLVK
jgi:hypothetical protein